MSCEELTHWKRPWCWEGLGTGGEGDDRGWDSWMASPTRWTCVWVNSGSLWWTGRPGVLWFMRSQSWTRLSDWTELNWTECMRRGGYSNKALPLPTNSFQVGGRDTEKGICKMCIFGMWDPSSQARDRTCVPYSGRQILNHYTTREVLKMCVLE